MLKFVSLVMGLGVFASLPEAGLQAASGYYVERSATGETRCDVPGAAQFELRVLRERPHVRSRNLGFIDFQIDGVSGLAVIQVARGFDHGAMERPVGAVASGGVPVNAGRDAYGVTDGVLSGDIKIALIHFPNGDIRLRTLSGGLHPSEGPLAEVVVLDGATAAGRRLRVFSRCADTLML